jgi:type IV pilus modification protein PilV
MSAARGNAGFSLVEVMCAILILGIGVVGLTQGIAAALRSSKEIEVQTAAAFIAAGQIETLRADGIISDGVTEGDADEGPYRWKQTVSTSTLEGLHEVQVEVEAASSGQLIYELKTLLFDAPLMLDDVSPKDKKKNEGRR